MPPLSTGTAEPTGLTIDQEPIYIEGSPDVWFQDAAAPLAKNPDGIDTNYFYADYLISEHNFAEAREYLLKAQHAAPRPGRALDIRVSDGAFGAIVTEPKQ